MTRQQLIDSLTATHDAAQDSIETSDGSIDWSTVDGDRRAFDVHSDTDGETVTLWMSRDELLDLHRKLTLTLLAAE